MRPPLRPLRQYVRLPLPCLSLSLSTRHFLLSLSLTLPPPSPPPSLPFPPPPSSSPPRERRQKSAVPSPSQQQRNSLHQPGATCRSMASCRWLVEPGTTPSFASPSLPPARTPARPLPLFFLLLLPTYPFAFSPLSFYPARAKACTRRVDPIREGELFL